MEKIRAGYDAFNRGDHDAWINQLHPEVELYELPTSPDGTVYRGRAGVREWIRSIWDVAGPGSRFEPEWFVEKDDLVVVSIHALVFARESRVPIETRLFHVHEMRDGMTRRIRGYTTEREALEAAGLSEQDAHADSS